ncbi:MAG: hypothetical protein D6725_14220, partial [Planctomycetota bacterium]
MLRERLQHACAELDLMDCRLLLAVSGGPDSVAMLRLFAALRRALRVDLFVAHFNHR